MQFLKRKTYLLKNDLLRMDYMHPSQNWCDDRRQTTNSRLQTELHEG